MSKAQALREAQLKLISDMAEDAVVKYPHPYFWAAFTITGEYR
ncbi:MAG: CHAT domain-containing protein [Candidatus Hodarchaeota archaeon]